MNDIYNHCLNCGESLVHTEGKREKVFCDTTCRSNYWQKSERLEKKGLTAEQIVATITKGWKDKKPEIMVAQVVKAEDKQSKKEVIKSIHEKNKNILQRLPNESSLDYKLRVAEFYEQNQIIK